MEAVADLSELPDFDNFSMYDLYISWQIILRTKRSRKDLENVFVFVKDDNDIRIEDVTNGYKEEVDIEFADKRLGEVLLERGGITEKTLTDALRNQKRLGDILVEDGKIRPEDVEKAVALQEGSRAAYRKTTIRVDVEKIDSLVNLGEEIGIGLSKVHALLEKYPAPGHTEIMGKMGNLLKVNREFQERVARVRMLPLEGTFRRFQRTARDLASQQNKQIKVILTGVDTELDKEIIEHLADPLKHLVLNCVDHGLETPEERQAKGKPPVGLIEFKAYQRAGRIFVEIRDDGRGIDLTAIERRAVEGDWIEPDQAVSKETLLGLMFEPGFSTTSKVTRVSGRGIGMDVVKTQLDQLGGTVGILTEEDRGTAFTICLPMTSALMEVLHVMVQETLYLVPQQPVIATEKFDKRLVRSLGAREKVYPFRGDYLPLVDLVEIFDTGMPSRDGNGAVVIFVDTGRNAFGIPVDDVLDYQQVTVKALETNYRSVRGVAGATILGDGSVSLVLDLLGLEEMLFRDSFKGNADYEGKGYSELDS